MKIETMKMHSRDSEMYLNAHLQTLQTETAAFRVFYWGVNPEHKNNPIHRHSFFEICYVVSGEGQYMDNYVKQTLEPGTLFVSRPGISHQILSKQGMFLLYTAFRLIESESSTKVVEEFNRLANIQPCLIRDMNLEPTILTWLALVGQAGQRNAAANAPTHLLATALLSSFPSAFHAADDIPTPGPPKPSSSGILYRARLFIDDNLSTDLRLRTVADYLHISPRHLSRIFAEYGQTTFTEYVKDRRIKRACHLLLTTDLSIKQISEFCGFSSVHYFSNVFAATQHIPPARFRKMKQSDSYGAY